MPTMPLDKIATILTIGIAASAATVLTTAYSGSVTSGVFMGLGVALFIALVSEKP